MGLFGNLFSGDPDRKLYSEWERKRTSWDYVKKNLGWVLHDGNLHEEFELLVNGGFSADIPGRLEASEKAELLRRAIKAREEKNDKAFGDMPEPRDRVAVARLGSWLFNMYRTDIGKMIPKSRLPFMSILADRATVLNIRKYFELRIKMSGLDDPYPGDMSEISAKKWRDYLWGIKGFALLICQTPMLMEDAMFMPGLAMEFFYNNSLGMIHIPSLDAVLLNASAARNLNLLPDVDAKRKLDIESLKPELQRYQWTIQSYEWLKNPV